MVPPSFRLVSQSDSAWGRVMLWQHDSGAHILQRADPDDAFAFAIGFPTPAPDDSGLTHVLEHLVFRGSRLHGDDHLYTALRSGSLAFHLNASTGPEWTSYHCASVSLADALRLEAALLDTVFQPLLRQEAFHQEAYDPARDIGGVVHNEMRGHLARIEARLDHALRRGLFGCTPSGLCYGGLPEAIRLLDLQALRAYHHRHYHPAGALILMTGADPDGARLAVLDRALRAHPPSVAIDPPKVPPQIVQDQIDDHGFWGMIFPDMPQDQKLLLAEIILIKARAELGPALLAQSGFVDGLQPYLALYWASSRRIDPLDWLQCIGMGLVDQATKTLRQRFSDEETDFRLPADLQIWPRLAAAHLRGDDLGQSLMPISACVPEGLDRFAQSLASLPVNHPPAPPPQLDTPKLHRPVPQPTGFFTLLDLDATRLPPTPQPPEMVDGIALLAQKAEGPVRLCLWCDGSDLSARDTALLPALAASLRHAFGPISQCHNGNRVGLLIELRLDPEDVAPWLQRLEAWFDAPPPAAPQADTPLHIAAEFHLRAAFSPQWRQVNRLCGIIVQRGKGDIAGIAHKLRQNCVAACSSARLLSLLRPWTSGIRRYNGIDRSYLAQDRILAAPCDLFILGLGLDLPQADQNHLLVALKAIETDFLWPELRSKGGAYGLRSSLEDGILTLTSIRDPQGIKALQVMETAPQWLSDHATQPQTLQRAKLAAMAQHLRPKPPSQRLREALIAPATPFDANAIRQTTPDDLCQIAPQMQAALSAAARLILGSDQMLARDGLRSER